MDKNSQPNPPGLDRVTPAARLEHFSASARELGKKADSSTLLVAGILCELICSVELLRLDEQARQKARDEKLNPVLASVRPLMLNLLRKSDGGIQ